ncbi:hypothetical protein EGW08_006962 [Elysia chlorotica]|uniref:DH domain-containing protein n=1 Tax=Elysia chlorotica TaxID=188477 RepID=A0A3S1BNX7_ELYCH|nr:hypothetical protein EGW08_006962 [Elysia chlorotica]
MQHPELSELCKERQLALGHGLPLGAYLLRPVQRILKYHLLLQNIVKNCEKENGGSGSRSERGSTSSTVSSTSGPGCGASAILEQAFQHMTHMASHINEMKRKHEHAVRIQEIQSQLEDYVGEDLTRLGDLVLESTFRVYGAKASRQVFLFERGLLISKKKEGGMLSCKTFIRCSNLMLVEVIPNEPLSFHTIPFDNPRAQYTLQARNMEQKRRWCQEMKRLILESYKAKIPDSVKSLVMQLGRNHDDDYVTKEALEAVRKNQHTAPEYLEKRRFRRKSGPRLPDFSLLKPQRARKGANNKKGEKGVEISKLSPELARRAESKSPDSQRKFLIKQMSKKRSQSHTVSLPTTPLSETTHQELFEHSNLNSKKPHKESRKSGTVKTSTPEKTSQHEHLSHTSTLGNSSSSLSSLTSHVATSLMSSPESLSSTLNSSSNYQTSSETKLNEIRNDAEDNGDDIPEDSDLITKRATSFRKALRANPITSADISELVVRCGGAGSIHASPSKRSSTDKQNALNNQDAKCSSSAGDKTSGNGPKVKDKTNSDLVKSDLDDTDNEDYEFHRNNQFRISDENIEYQISEMSRAISNGSFLSQLGNHENENHSCVKEEKSEVSAKNKSIASRSASLPLLNDSDDDEDCTGSEKQLNERCTSANINAENLLVQQQTGHPRKTPQQHNCSHSVEDICGEPKRNVRNAHSGRGRMSRRDLQDRSSHVKKKSLGSHDMSSSGLMEINKTPVNQYEKAKEELDVDKTSNVKSESDDKRVLLRNKVKGLRLPNTHKHLSVQDYTSMSALRNKASADGSKARLIGWSSADKLTKGSMTDLSHLSEDPWVRKTEVALAEKEKKKTLSTASVAHKSDLDLRDRSNSANLSSSSSCGGSKENLDWLVYLNRNASGSLQSPLNPAASLSSNKILSNESVDKITSPSVSEAINTNKLSQCRDVHTSNKGTIPAYTTLSKVIGVSKNLENIDRKKDDFLSQPAVGTIPNPTKITLTKPVKLQETSSLSRSNSLPTTCGYGKGMSYSALKTLSKNRHSSIQNVDNLSEQESAQRMIAEMEEYIKAVTEPSHESVSYRCLPKRFPTSLPAITVEEEDAEDENDDDDTQPSGSNRLSVISSVSTSSYESQGSWSSGGSDEMTGGLVGSLRHKLHTWAKDSNFGEEQERRTNSSSDSGTINRTSALESDDESDDVYLEKDTHHSHLNERLKGDTSNLPSTHVKNEERQLETVLREHSLGSSSLGSRMANTAVPPGNFSATESSSCVGFVKMNKSTCLGNTSSERSLQDKDYDNCISDRNIAGHVSGRVSASVCDVNISVNADITGQDKTGSALPHLTDPLATRLSLPPTKEAAEALMPAALRGDSYEIQQSDSGFSLQSSASSSNDGSSSNGDLAESLDASPVLEDIPGRLQQGNKIQSNFDSNTSTSMSDSPKLVSKAEKKSPNLTVGNIMSQDHGMKRNDSCASMDSTDSFYERRLSVAFESDVFGSDPHFNQRSIESADELPTLSYPVASSRPHTLTTATTTRLTFPLTQADAETPLSRKSIREYVQSIEEMFKPRSPKVMEVRRREPGEMIRQRLQNLRDQVVYGSQDSSDERGRGYARSKSQPPSQHRSTLLPSSSQSSLSSTTSGCAAEGGGPGSYQPRCSDDIFVYDRKVSGSRDSLVSIQNVAKPCALWGSRESVFFPPSFSSKAKGRLNGSKEILYGSRESLKDKNSSLNLKRSVSKEIVTRESILASPVLARKDNKNVCQSPHHHQFPDQGHLMSPAALSSPTILDGDKTKHGKDLADRCSLPPATASSPHHWRNKNQFVHRARSSSDRSCSSLSERASSPVSINSDGCTSGIKVSSSFSASSPLLDSQQQQLSKSTGGLDQMSTEVDNLVIMKGWVRSLISKFQDQP